VIGISGAAQVRFRSYKHRRRVAARRRETEERPHEKGRLAADAQGQREPGRREPACTHRFKAVLREKRARLAQQSEASGDGDNRHVERQGTCVSSSLIVVRKKAKIGAKPRLNSAATEGLVKPSTRICSKRMRWPR
jgi:hypothetical protein